MIQDINQIVLSCGITHCTKLWNQTGRQHYDECLKLYLPIDGHARISFGAVETELLADNIYFINGTKMQFQECPKSMDVAWLHFIPSSLKLKYMLFKHVTFYRWQYSQVPFSKDLLRLLGKMVSGKEDILSPDSLMVKPKLEDSLLCKIHGMMTYLIGDVIEKNNLTSNSQELAAFQRFDAAINFMDLNYDTNPSLKKIAGKVFMAPASFHRSFKSSFGITPFDYMLTKRLSKARQLLSTTSLSIKEIASECGYENEFYFSRVFKKRFGVSPSQHRNTEWTA
jgi:AraC-like DNA-binding protein